MRTLCQLWILGLALLWGLLSEPGKTIAVWAREPAQEAGQAAPDGQAALGQAGSGEPALVAKSQPAPALENPLPPEEVARLLAEVSDGGFSVDDAPTLALVGRVAREKPEAFAVGEAGPPVKWDYLLQWSRTSRGKLFVLEGLIVNVAEQVLGAPLGPDGPTKLYLVTLAMAPEKEATVLVTDNPGDTNARVRMRAYFVRVYETPLRLPRPLLVARTLEFAKVQDKPGETGAKSSSEPPPITPDYGTSDGLPDFADPRARERLREAFEDPLFRDGDTITDAPPAYAALEMVAGMSDDVFRLGAKDYPEKWTNPLESPTQYRSGELVCFDGVVREITEWSNKKGSGRPGPFWILTMSDTAGGRHVHTVIVHKKPTEEPKFRTRFKGYFIKTRTYQTRGGELEQGGVFVTRLVEPYGGELNVENAPRNAAEVLRDSLRGDWGWVMVAVLTLLIIARYVTSRRSLVVNEASPFNKPGLARAEPLNSPAVIDSLSKMAGQDDGPGLASQLAETATATASEAITKPVPKLDDTKSA